MALRIVSLSDPDLEPLITARGAGGLRVLIVATEAPPIRSGISEVVYQLARGLRGLGHDVEVLTAQDLGRISMGEFRLTGMASRWRDVSARIQDFDVINLHGPAPTFSDFFLMLWRTLPSRRRPALVYTYHSEIDLLLGRPVWSAYNQVHRWLTRVADHVVASTPSYRQIALRGGARDVSVIPFGGPSPAPLPLAPEPGRGPRFRVAFVGQLRPYKGVDILLRAAAHLPDVDFEIVGGGHQEEALKALAAGLQLTNVTWHGRVDDLERDAILRRSHALALPSLTRAEAFGIALLEGMRAGCVPIASALPGVSDVAGETGLLVRPGSARSIVQAICCLRDDPADTKRRSAASIVAAARYGWDGTAGRYHRVLNEAMIHRQLRYSCVDDRLIEAVRGGSAADRASLMLLDRSDGLRIASVAGLPIPRQSQLHPAGESVAWRALESGRLVVLDGSPTDGRGMVQRSLVLPVRAGHSRGVLNLSRVTDRSFHQEEIAWVVRQAEQIPFSMWQERDERRPAAAAQLRPAMAWGTEDG